MGLTMTRRIRIGACIPDPRDGTSLYRGVGPLSHLVKNYDVEVTYLPTIDAVSIHHYDCIFMQRPSGEPTLELAKMVKRSKIPLWIDFDDYPFEVGHDNPMHKHYANERVKEATFYIMQLADVTTVTHKTLKDLLMGDHEFQDGTKQSFGRNVVVVPNAYDKRFHGDLVTTKRKKLISWRGGLSHEKDLFVFTPMIKRVLEKNKDWEMEFVGGVPWYIKEQFDPSQVTFTELKDFLSYREHMVGLRASVNIVPLHDSLLSRCRSNIAYIETTTWGSMNIVPAWESWRDCNSVYRYSDKTSFEEVFSIVLRDYDLEKHNVSDNFKYNLEHLDLDLVNEIRMEVIQNLIGGYYGS